MNATCGTCLTPTRDSFLCATCWNALAVDLADLAGYQRNGNGERMIPLAVELEVVLSRQDRLGKVSVMVSGTTERPLPVNLHAGRVRDRLDAVIRAWVDHMRGPDPTATIITNAQWLLHHEHDVRGLHDVEDLVEQVHGVIEEARRVIDKRSVRVYVGQCGAEVEAGDEEPWLCKAALWADSAYAMTRCHVCDTSHPSMERWESYLGQVQAERLEAAAPMHLGPRKIASVLTALGLPVDESTVRKWSRLGRIESTGVDEHGRKTYLVADIMDLLAEPDLISAS